MNCLPTQRRTGASLLCLALAGLASDPSAQSCALVQDLNVSGQVGFSSEASGSRQPLPGNHFARGLIQLGGDRYFTAKTLAHGQELWKTDGTTAGTVRVSDIAPGPLDSDIDALFVADLGSGPRLWFRADDGTTGVELWTSDGTAAGTRRVKDIQPGSDSGNPFSMEQIGSRLIFRADDGTTGAEIWISDGTDAGTVQLVDLRPGSLSSSPMHFLTDAAGTTCYFRANDGVHGNELWRTDGTVAGTTMVRDIAIGSGSSSPNYLTNHNGTVLFVATAPNGTELWRTDGTRIGTRVVKDINPGSGSSSPNLFYVAAIGNDYYFRASDGINGAELWRTDGTPNGTVLLYDLKIGPSGSRPDDLFATGGSVYFEADEGYGLEPCVFDGTNTYSIADLRQGSASSSPGDWAALPNGNVLFSATNGNGFGAAGRELFLTDGTPAGTRLLADLEQGVDDSSPMWLTALANGRVLLTAETTNAGRELWISDGTTANTNLLLDIEPSAQTDGSSPVWEQQAISGSTLYFEADDGVNGDELWQLRNGTARMLLDIHPLGDSNPSGFTEFFNGTNTLVLFTADDGRNGMEPWVTDGTPGGTRLLADIQTGRSSSSPSDFTVFNNRVFFSASSQFGRELFVTDGTLAGTRAFLDIRPGTLGSSPSDLVVFDGRLFFAASDGTRGTEVWVSDGTAAGTTLFADLAPGSSSSRPRLFTEVGNRLFFRASTFSNGTELYVTDGTSGGTDRVVDIRPGTSSSNPDRLTECNGRLFFTANDGTNGTELWFSDGTAAGTAMIRDIYVGSSSSSPDNLICSGNTLYFAAYSGFLNGGRGREIWRTDGTTAGTVEVADIRPGGSSGGMDYPLVAGGGGLYFVANDGITGTELYYTDGTSAGTERVCDVAPGSASSFPRYLTCIDNQIVFRATSPAVGAEIFELPSAPRANTMRYGDGCGPAFARIEATDPVIGSTATLSGKAPPSVPGVALLGTPTDALPMLFSAPCALYIDLRDPIANVGTLAGPNWSANLPVPADPRLIGGNVAVQAFFLYGSPVMASTSNAVRLILGR